MYTMKQAAELTKMSVHTLRFYANKGLFPFISRDYNNVRWFSDEDIEKIKVVLCLRKTGMPISDIKSYLLMCVSGEDKKFDKRYELFVRQEKKAVQELEELKEQIEHLQLKMEYYRECIEVGRHLNYYQYVKDIEKRSKNRNAVKRKKAAI